MYYILSELELKFNDVVVYHPEIFIFKQDRGSTAALGFIFFICYTLITPFKTKGGRVDTKLLLSATVEAVPRSQNPSCFKDVDDYQKMSVRIGQ